MTKGPIHCLTTIAAAALSTLLVNTAWAACEPAGDINEDGVIDATDIDIISTFLRGGTPALGCEDVNGDHVFDDNDRTDLIAIIGTLPGDANLDCTVSFSDFLAVSQNFSGTGGWSDGDTNGDGLVNFSDFLAVSRNFSLSGACALSNLSVSGPRTEFSQGGEQFGPYIHTDCVANEVMVGLRTWYRGENVSALTGVSARCAPLNGDGSLGAIRTSNAVLASGGTVTVTDCPEDMMVAGITVVDTGNEVQRFILRCGTPMGVLLNGDAPYNIDTNGRISSGGAICNQGAITRVSASTSPPVVTGAKAFCSPINYSTP